MMLVPGTVRQDGELAVSAEVLVTTSHRDHAAVFARTRETQRGDNLLRAHPGVGFGAAHVLVSLLDPRFWLRPGRGEVGAPVVKMSLTSIMAHRDSILAAARMAS